MRFSALRTQADELLTQRHMDLPASIQADRATGSSQKLTTAKDLFLLTALRALAGSDLIAPTLRTSVALSPERHFPTDPRAGAAGEIRQFSCPGRHPTESGEPA